jgi:hypothetical protein
LGISWRWCLLLDNGQERKQILRSGVFSAENILRSGVYLMKNILRSAVFYFVIEIKSVQYLKMSILD